MAETPPNMKMKKVPTPRKKGIPNIISVKPMRIISMMARTLGVA